MEAALDRAGILDQSVIERHEPSDDEAAATKRS